MQRTHIATIITMLLVLTTGCLVYQEVTWTDTSNPEMVQVEDVELYEEHPLGTGASMDVTASGIDGATAVVWLDATGGQIAAERFPYGGGRIHLYAPSVSDGDIYGENTIAFVTGGDLECVRDVCEQTGGEAVVTVTFEIHRGA